MVHHLAVANFLAFSPLKFVAVHSFNARLVLYLITLIINLVLLFAFTTDARYATLMHGPKALTNLAM